MVLILIVSPCFLKPPSSPPSPPRFPPSMEAQIVQRYHFASHLKRMAAVLRVSSESLSGFVAVVKVGGSPEGEGGGLGGWRDRGWRDRVMGGKAVRGGHLGSEVHSFTALFRRSRSLVCHAVSPVATQPHRCVGVEIQLWLSRLTKTLSFTSQVTAAFVVDSLLLSAQPLTLSLLPTPPCFPPSGCP